MSRSPGTEDFGSLSSLGDPVRRRLYEVVASSAEPVGRDDAAAAVGIGRALAAYHLDKLLKAGLLTASHRRRAGRGGPGAGRPAKVYARSGREFTVSVPPREYELAAGLLVGAVASDTSGRSRAALCSAAWQRGAQLGERCRAQISGPGDAWRTLQAVLSEQGFEPCCDEGGVVRLRNCPFRRLTELDADIVCGMNLALIDGVVAGMDSGGLHPTLDPWPGHCCVAISPDPAGAGKLRDETRRTGAP